jgi:hypothetical protein
MSFMRRWFPSFDGSAHVSPYFYVPPKRRWWPTLLTLAAAGVCVLALLGPSHKTGNVAALQKAERPLVLQVRPGDAVAAKDLASPPAAVAENAGEVHAKSAAPSGEALPSEAAPVPQQPNAAAPTSAMASVEAGNARIPPETRIVSAPARPTVAKRYARQSTQKSSASRQHVAKKVRRHEAPTDGYAYDYSGYRRYRFAGERAYGGYWGSPGGYYGQRGGWF